MGGAQNATAEVTHKSTGSQTDKTGHASVLSLAFYSYLGVLH